MGGDADGLVHIRLHNVDDDENGTVVIAKATGTQRPLHFYPVDATASAGTLTTDSSVPGGKRLDMSAANLTTGVTVSWTLTNPHQYDGEYLIYVVGVGNTSFDHVHIFYDVSSDERMVQAHSIEVSNYWSRMCLGRIRLPKSPSVAGKTYGNQTLQVVFNNQSISGSTATFKLYEVHLIPISEGVIQVGNLKDADLVVDGGASAVYQVSSSDPNDIVYVNSGANSVLRGGRRDVVFGVDPARDTRIYFFRYEFSTVSWWDEWVHYPPTEMDVSVRVTPRWKGVRDD